MSGLQDLLRQRLGDCSPAERKVARVLLAGYPMAGLETAATLAGRAGVSAPTVIRLVSRLGFTGLPDFQHAVREELSGRTASPVSLYDSSGFSSTATTDSARLIEESGTLVGTAVQQTFGELPPTELARAVELIADRRRRIRLHGGRFTHLLAHYIALHLAQLRSDVGMLPDTVVEQVAAVAGFSKRDVLVLFDYRRYEPTLLQTATVVHERGGAVILFTDPWLSPIAALADVVLPCKVDSSSPYDSLVPSLAAAELLVTGVLAALGPAAHHHMQSVEDVAHRLSQY